MKGFSPAVEGVAIVLLGDFNPAIFQPAWFAAQGLLRNEEGIGASIELIRPEIVRFNLEWLQIEVVRDRFAAITVQGFSIETLRDLVVGTFRVLGHTPIRSMGINREVHVKSVSDEDWHTVGDRLAPKEIWRGLLDKPGMRNLVMEGVRDDGYSGYIRVYAEPSQRVRPGVFFRVNDHFEIDGYKSEQGAAPIVRILEDQFDVSRQRSDRIIATLWERL